MHNPVNQKDSYQCESNQLKMVGPWFSVLNLCYNNLLWFFGQSLTASNRCLVSSWGSFHLFCLHHWRHDSFRFLWSWWLDLNWLFPGFFSWFFYWLLCGSWNWFFNWFFDLSLFNDFLGCWGWLLVFRSAFAWRLLNSGFNLFSCILSFLDRNLRASFLNWRFSLSDWRFHASLSLVTLNNFFQSKPRLFQIHFKFNGILLWDVNFLLKSVNALLLEICDVCGRVNINSSEVILFGGVFFCEFKGESDFSAFVKVGQIEVELTSSERHDMSAVSINEICIGRDLVLVELLLSCLIRDLYLCRLRTWIWTQLMEQAPVTKSGSQDTVGSRKIQVR